jgi:predicted GNAT family acetyltransferase
VPLEYRGHGYASELAKRVLGDIVQRGLKVVPDCIFMADYIESHPEYAELVATERR